MAMLAELSAIAPVLMAMLAELSAIEPVLMAMLAVLSSYRRKIEILFLIYHKC